MRSPPEKRDRQQTSVEVASVLFTDLVDSTALAARVGPVAADDLQVEFFQILRSGIEATSGREVKNLGDGLMFAFSSPSTALDAATKMQQELDRRNRDAEEPLSVRMGLSMGEVTLLEGDYYGPSVIEAARLCALARGGQILVTEIMRMMAGRGEYRFKPVGALELKGLVEPVPTCELEWEPLGAAELAIPLPPRLRSVPPVGFVGRVSERAQLEGLLERARSGERGVALVSGEPGIGKTRLCANLVINAHGTGTTVLYGRAEEDVAAPYGPWIEALRHYVEHAPEAVLKAHADRHGGELVRLAPNLARRVDGLPRPRDSDPETERYLLWAAVTDLLEEASSDVPMALLLDDLHWADKQTLSLLLRVASSAVAARLLILGTYRDSDLTRRHPLTELLAALRREPGTMRIQLTGLEGPEIVALMEAAAGHELDRTGHGLAQEVRRETDGNPFFVAELLRHLVESGALYQGADGRWTLRGPLGELGLPQSIREVIDRRVERLGAEATRVLSVAAVIGRDFDLALLQPVVGGDEDPLLDLLDEACEASLIAESEAAPGRFTFMHALINHALYEGLGPTRRARTHRQVAEALERMYGDEPGARLGELANHWTHATVAIDSSKAVEYSRRAGENALAELAPDEALRWFTQALELLPEPHDTAERCELLIGLGEAQRQVGEPEFRDTLLDAARIALEIGDHDRLAQAALANTRGFTSEIGRVDDERLEILEAAAARLPAEDLRRADVLTLLAMELTWAGPTSRRVELAQEGLALARAGADAETLMHVIDRYLYAIWLPRTLEERLELSAELLELAEGTRDPLRRQMAFNRRIYYVIEAGHGHDADRVVAGMRETAARFPQPFLQWVARYQSAMVTHMHGRLEEAEALCDQAVAIGTDGGEPDALLLYAAQLVGIRYDQGRVDEVLELAEQSVEDFPLLPAWHAFYVTALCQLGRHDDALAQIATIDLDGLPDDFLLPATLSYYAEACADVGAVSLAADLSARLEPFGEQVCTNGVTVVGPVSHYLGRLAAVGRDHDQAAGYFDQAIATCRGLDAPVMQARSEIAWAQALLAARDADAGEHANRLLRSARARAEEFGARDLTRRIDAVAALRRPVADG
jgi:class 3 adenylate cyclase/tetratricopeptide (TPR) repeat protein